VAADSSLDDEILAIGKDLAAAFPSAARRPLKALDDRAMDLASSDAELKAALFRFVDVVPACRNLDDLARHLTGFLGEIDDAPPPIAAAMRMGETKAGRKALGMASAAGVRHMAHRFIVGESPQDALPTLRTLWKRGVATSVDLLGEATVTESEADRYAERCAAALDGLTAAYTGFQPQPRLEADSYGPLPRANLSVKVSALTPLLRPDAPERGKRDAAPRLRELLRRAKRHDAHLHIDMESLDSREAVTDLVLELLAEPEFADGPAPASCSRPTCATRPSSPTGCSRSRATRTAPPARHPPGQGRLLGPRGRRGPPARLGLPRLRGQGRVRPHLRDADPQLLEARPHVRVAIASHNLRSVAHALAVNRRLGADDRDVELQVLRGLGDDLQDALAARGFRVRTYCPVGDLVAGMAYLVRRLLENTSNESFLSEQASGASLDKLLAAP
jgi:RHH-type proline utilization regulon transcriptional repressor/proline dehydrogenase/delta 1-pyrroline-5-carboxylate dehydrogenase